METENNNKKKYKHIDLSTPSTRLTGTQIAHELLNFKPDGSREDYIFARFFEGHVPFQSYTFFPIEIKFMGGTSSLIRSATLYASCDYVSLGTDDDYIRCPLNPLTAQRIADLTGCVLPTPQVVDYVWSAAEIRLDPLPWGPPYDSSMMSSQRLIEHSRRIDRQLTEIGSRNRYCLIAGHKKDVVIHNVLSRKNNSVAIYGWHQSSGRPIQALYKNSTTGIYEPYTGHSNKYKDYSHGIRLIWNMVTIGGTDSYSPFAIDVDVCSAMIDPELWPIFGIERQNVCRQPVA